MKNCKKHIKIVLITIILFIYVGLTNTVLAEVTEMPYSEAYIKWLNLPEEERNDILQPEMFVKNANAEELEAKPTAARRLKTASKFDLRDSISIKLKDQMSTGSCWAFTGTTVMETHMALVKNRNVEFSPRHIEYSCTRTFLDGINNIPFNREVDMGGNNTHIAAYFTSGRGPVFESDMPFQNSIKKINLSEINKSPRMTIEEYRVFPSISKTITNGRITYSNGAEGAERIEYDYSEILQIRDEIKEHITKYGAVTSCMAFYTELFSSDHKSFNCKDAKYWPNHEITIIGWDDNYPVSNFKSKYAPSQPGAWLIQNSHGNKNSYFYISYEDIYVEEEVMGIIEMNDTDYDKLYQYDFVAPNHTIQVYKDESYAVNVFKKDESVEFLNKVSFYTCEDEEYEVYVNPFDGTRDEKKFIKLGSIDKTNSDYVTLKLDEQVALPNKEFAVIVKYINKSGKVGIPIEMQSGDDNYVFCSSNSGESFFYNNVVFKDLSTSLINANVCVKAFTKENASNPKSFLVCNKYEISESNMINKVLPDTTLGEFGDEIFINAKYKILDKNKNEMKSDADIITTGAKIVTDYDENYTITVKGDANGDGKVTGTDLLIVKRYILELDDLTGEYLIASDINGDDETTPTDALNIKQFICDLVSF